MATLTNSLKYESLTLCDLGNSVRKILTQDPLLLSFFTRAFESGCIKCSCKTYSVVEAEENIHAHIVHRVVCFMKRKKDDEQRWHVFS